MIQGLPSRRGPREDLAVCAGRASMSYQTLNGSYYGKSCNALRIFGSPVPRAKARATALEEAILPYKGGTDIS